MCLLAIWISSFEKTLLSWCAHFFIGSLTFCEFIFLSFLYIVVISPLSNVYLVKIFSYSVGCLLNFETISFVVQIFYFICQFFLLVP
jgi:hypothetical protein